MASQPLKRIYFDTNFLYRWPHPPNDIYTIFGVAKWLGTQLLMPEVVERELEAQFIRSVDAAEQEDHWAIVDLKGKAGHTRTIPMPGWVKTLLDDWVQAANLTSGKLFRRVNKNGKAWVDGLTEKAV